jgi:hypothetical protein
MHTLSNQRFNFSFSDNQHYDYVLFCLVFIYDFRIVGTCRSRILNTFPSAYHRRFKFNPSAKLFFLSLKKKVMISKDLELKAVSNSIWFNYFLLFQIHGNAWSACVSKYVFRHYIWPVRMGLSSVAVIKSAKCEKIKKQTATMAFGMNCNRTGYFLFTC